MCFVLQMYECTYYLGVKKVYKLYDWYGSWIYFGIIDVLFGLD